MGPAEFEPATWRITAVNLFGITMDDLKKQEDYQIFNGIFPSKLLSSDCFCLSMQ